MIIAESDAMVKLLEYADHVAAVDSTVILYGESGSGKEMFAKYIHARSDRADQVFIPINCASLPPLFTGRGDVRLRTGHLYRRFQGRQDRPVRVRRQGHYLFG